ncbi:MAG: hypothetical protein QW227_00340 [Candidatus Aenigmatarchaeota archaeon]|nr:hypothetical protein [Candidatus Aenigmarchaeota archaeon]
MPHSAKGSRRERELLELLSKQGLVVHRVAGSGLHNNAICDLIAIDNKGQVQLIEVKSRKSTYYPNDHAQQLQELVNVAKTCNAKPVLAVKLNYKQWQFIDLRKGIPDKVA